MLNKSEYQMTKIDSAELVAGRNMFRKLENLNFVIVSACDEPLGLSNSALSSLPKGSGRKLRRVDFEFRASNFTF
jgi:hypothetical protein